MYICYLYPTIVKVEFMEIHALNHVTTCLWLKAGQLRVGKFAEIKKYLMKLKNVTAIMQGFSLIISEGCHCP